MNVAMFGGRRPGISSQPSLSQPSRFLIWNMFYNRHGNMPNLPASIVLLRLLDSNFPGNSLWAWEFHPLKLRSCLNLTPRNPQC